ncbi:C-type lectin domain family 4 member A-like [Amphiprion ocellaris]|uniref:C-type lectin domain-containing protein n=1 Tax=Amphiprion ocellaris TaxID=80972 RepID=A0A3Q1AWJ3_AMPOC|nr:C-type lectin domain family 4 member A-like [Amphiprion ocellaris]
MSSNIYEVPNVTTSVRYSKGVGKDRGERLERVVDIYESTDAFIDHQVDTSARDGGAHTQNHLPAVQRYPFRAATLCLALLCFLLFLGMTFLSHFYFTLVLKNNQLIKDAELTVNSECETDDNDSRWRRFKCHCYYTSTEMKTWAESREDCRKRRADLVVINNEMEQKYIHDLNKHGDSWIGLEGVTGSDWKWKWQWVDSSPLTGFTAWNKDVKLIPVDETKVYIDLQGKWNVASSGAKYWICERQIY